MRGRLRVSLGLLVLVSLAVFMTACPNGGVLPPDTAPAGDYGDAPDGGETGYPAQWPQTGVFPTLFASDGARTLSADDATLGATASLEVDADDPSDPDGEPNLNPSNTDSDDGLVELFIALTQIPPPTTLTVEVNGPEGGTGGTFYLNALIDLDMDGDWGGSASGGECEWVVKNYEVTVTPGVSEPITPDAFAFSAGNRLPDQAWMRIALTSEPIEGEPLDDDPCGQDWDGTGEFSSGEIEDHMILLPDKDAPMLTVNCNGPYVFPKGSVAGAQTGPVMCTVTNFAFAGDFQYELIRLDLNGNVAMAAEGTNLCVPAGTPSVPIGPATGFPPGPGANPVVLDCGNGQKTNNDPAWAQYKLVARAVDPASALFDGGINIGWSEESLAEFEFSEEVDDDVVPVCGDENLDDGEECDDGNIVDGDGCSAECTIEETGCSEMTGVLAYAVSISYDASGHGPYIGMPETLELSFEMNGIVAVTGSAPFVDVTGTTTDGSITAAGSGVVAGYPDIAVELNCDCAESTCSYRMGVNGGLPGGDEIIYSLDPL